MRVLDLFCKAGGASMGLHRAWPNAEITGVDIEPQRHYPFRFVQADALEFPLDGYDFIWASPPCQAFTSLRFLPNAKPHENLIPQIRERLLRSRTNWAIENVPGAPLGQSGHLTMLCGTMFGLRTSDGTGVLRRHRIFELSYPIILRPRCQHSRSIPTCTVVGKGSWNPKYIFTVGQLREAMDIPWMNRAELSQAVPPAYSEFIARRAPIHG